MPQKITRANAEGMTIVQLNQRLGRIRNKLKVLYKDYEIYEIDYLFGDHCAFLEHKIKEYNKIVRDLKYVRDRLLNKKLLEQKVIDYDNRRKLGIPKGESRGKASKRVE